MNIYSYSKLKCYEQCPQKYKLQYIDNIKTEVKENIECFLGRRVHETLKKLYKDLLYKKENTLEEILDFLYSQWFKNWSDSIIIVKKQYHPKDYLFMVKKYIIDYYNRYKPFNHGRTIGLEERIIINLDGSRNYKLCGYIDRLTEAEDGYYEIHDWKTCSRLPSLEDIKEDRQLTLYSIGVKQRYHDVRDIRLIWHFLKFDKEMNSIWTDKKIEEVKKNTIRLIDIIEATEEFSANPSKLCKWCRFKSICRQ